MSTVAVMNDRFMTDGKRKIMLPPLHGLNDLLCLIEREQLERVWIVKGAFASYIELSYNSHEWDVFVAGADEEKQCPTMIRAYRPGRGEHTIYIGFAEWTEWAWSETNDMKILFHTVNQLEHMLGIPVLWGPGHASIEFLRAQNQRHEHTWWQPIEADLREPGNAARKQVTIACELPGGRGEQLYLHHIDKNSMYMAAALRVLVGEGEPEFSADGSAYDGKIVGFWHVTIKLGGSVYHTWLSPALSREWATTELVEALKYCGYNVEIDAGWYWPVSHRALESTATALWSMRREYRLNETIVDQNIYRSISDLMHRLPGKIGSDTVHVANFARRDVKAQIEGRALANMLYNFERMSKELSAKLVLVKTDGLVFVSSQPKAIDLFGEWIDTGRLGGYKIVWSQPLTLLIREMWDSDHPFELMSFLHECAEGR